MERWEDDLLHGFNVYIVARTRGQRNVEVCAFTPSRATRLKPAGVAVIVPFLMNLDRQDIWAVIKNRLGAIAVVHIPIQHGDAPGQFVVQRGLNRDGDVGH